MNVLTCELTIINIQGTITGCVNGCYQIVITKHNTARHTYIMSYILTYIQLHSQTGLCTNGTMEHYRNDKYDNYAN